MAKFARFDAADYLDDDETVAEYISAALEDPNPDVFLTAVGMWLVPAAWHSLRRMPVLVAKAFIRH